MPAFQIQNQTPAVLNPNYAKLIKLMQTGDPLDLLTKNLSEKLYTNQNTVIKYQNKQLTPHDLTQLFIACLTGRVNNKQEDLAKGLLAQTVLGYQKSNNLLFKFLYAQIAATQANLPLPSLSSTYTINTDVIPQSKMFLAGQTTPEALFASFAFTFKPSVLGVAFKNEQDFNNFKLQLASYVHAQAGKLAPNALTKFKDFQREKLSGLTINLLLRQQDNDDQDPYSFSRILTKMLLLNKNSILMPFDVGELYNPTKLVLINIDRHAHATQAEIKHTWHQINQASLKPLKMLSNRHLMHLASSNRITNQIKLKAQKLQTLQQTNNLAKAKYAPLSKTKPNSQSIMRHILQALSRQKQVFQSSNTYKIQKRTFNRPNRRHPDDFNLPGKSVRTVYRPDLHIYLDTSGSISEENYQTAIKNCIMLAKKMNVDIYFNSFSHYLSPCYKLPLRNLTTKQIYAIFEAIPKVDGGTEYSNIWRYINQSKTRQKEFSLLITDFEYDPPDTNFKHPDNLYYAPIDTSNSQYQYIRYHANDFIKNMAALGHNIRNKLLF